MIGKLTKVKGSRVVGIDASTKSLAYAVIEDGKPVIFDEVFFEGSTVFERLKHAKQITKSLVESEVLKADYVIIEAAILAKDPRTAIDLGYVFGAILGELMESNPEVHKVVPISWQTAYGVPIIKKDEKEQMKKDFPDRKPSWYQAEGRRRRKERIMKKSSELFGKEITSDNIGDAVGIAWFGSTQIVAK